MFSNFKDKKCGDGGGGEEVGIMMGSRTITYSVALHHNDLQCFKTKVNFMVGNDNSTRLLNLLLFADALACKFKIHTI